MAKNWPMRRYISKFMQPNGIKSQHMYGCAAADSCKSENFLALLKRNCLPQPHASNAAHLNHP